MTNRILSAVTAIAAVAGIAAQIMTTGAEARSGSSHVPYSVNGDDRGRGPGSNGPGPAAAPSSAFRGIRNFVIVDGEPTGFGRFQRRQDVSFRPGDRVYVYGEPVGFGWSARGSGHHFQVLAEIEIRDRNGRVVWTAPNKVNLENSAARQTNEFYFHVFLELPRLDTGAYVVHYKFDDPHARTFVKFERNITVMSDRTTDTIPYNGGSLIPTHERRN